MILLTPSRLVPSRLKKVALGMVCALITGACVAQPTPAHRTAFGQQPPPIAASPRPQQEHLSQWMDRHRNLPPNQQQNALEREPGFRNLPQQTQQRMRDRLAQLNNMPPEQRRRLLERTEAMEQLTPQQRQQVRGAMQQLSNLPGDRRRIIARAFRDIREMPIPQRQIFLNSERIRTQFSDQERGTLANLLAVEPYLPAQQASDAPQYTH